MLDIRNKKLIVFMELIIFSGSLFFIISQNLDLKSSLGILAISALIPFFLMKPFYSLLFLFFIRNTTDLYTEEVFINFFDVININFSSLLGILVIIWAVLTILKEKIDLKKIPLLWPWLFFIAISSLSLIYSVDSANSLKTLTRIISFFLLYLIAYFYFTKYKDKKHYFPIALMISYIVPILLGVYQIIWQRGFLGPEGLNRINGTYFHPNSFAFNMFFLFFISVGFYVNSKNKKHKKYYLFLLALLSILILFTLTRSVWIALTVLIIILFFIFARKHLLNYGLLIIGLIFTFLILVNYTSLKYFDFNTISFINRVRESTFLLSSWEWRINLWGEMSEYIYQSPIIGLGLDSFRFLREKQVSNVYESLYAHNDYLKILIELGVIGLFFYLNLIFQTLKKIWQKYIINKDSRYLISFIGIILLYLIAGVDNLLLATSLQWVLWVYIAYLLV